MLHCLVACGTCWYQCDYLAICKKLKRETDDIRTPGVCRGFIRHLRGKLPEFSRVFIIVFWFQHGGGGIVFFRRVFCRGSNHLGESSYRVRFLLVHRGRRVYFRFSPTFACIRRVVRRFGTYFQLELQQRKEANFFRSALIFFLGCFSFVYYCELAGVLIPPSWERFSCFFFSGVVFLFVFFCFFFALFFLRRDAEVSPSRRGFAQQLRHFFLREGRVWGR